MSSTHLQEVFKTYAEGFVNIFKKYSRRIKIGNFRMKIGLVNTSSTSDNNPKPLSSKMNTQPFGQTGQMIELSCEYLFLQCIWLYLIIMSITSFRVNPHSIVCLNVKKLLAPSGRHIWSLSDSNVIRTHNHLFRKRTLNHLAKLAKWLSCVVITYL